MKSPQHSWLNTGLFGVRSFICSFVPLQKQKKWFKETYHERNYDVSAFPLNVDFFLIFFYVLRTLSPVIKGYGLSCQCQLRRGRNFLIDKLPICSSSCTHIDRFVSTAFSYITKSHPEFTFSLFDFHFQCLMGNPCQIRARNDVFWCKWVVWRCFISHYFNAIVENEIESFFSHNFLDLTPKVVKFCTEPETWVL